MNAAPASPVPGPRPLVVLHALRTADPAAGGFVTYLEGLRRGLAGRPLELPSESVFPRNRDWRVVALRRPLRFLGRVRRRLRGADLLHLHGVFGWHVLLAAAAARASARPYVVTVHGHLHRDALRERGLAKRVYLALAGRRILEDAAAVLVATPAERDLVRRRAPGARVAEVLPGLEVPARPRSGAAADERAPPGPLGVLYLGRLHPHKGLHVLVRALAAARDAGLDAELAVAGGGRRRYRRGVERLAARLGIAARVHFLGHVDAARRERLLVASQLFVLPSRSENFAYAVAEAMGAGMPVIVSANVGLAPLVERCRCGRVVPVDDPEALRRALLDYADPALRREHGRRAHATARESFAIAHMAAAHEALYREAAGAPDATAAAPGR